MFYFFAINAVINFIHNSLFCHSPLAHITFCIFLRHGKGQQFDNKKEQHCVKSVQMRSFSGPYFPVLGLNMEIYSVNLRIQPEYGKIRTRKNSVFGHFSRSAMFLIQPKILKQPGSLNSADTSVQFQNNMKKNPRTLTIFQTSLFGFKAIILLRPDNLKTNCLS